VSKLPHEAPKTRTPTQFSEYALLAFAYLAGALASKVALPGEGYGESARRAQSALYLIALISGLFLNLSTGCAIRNQRLGQARNDNPEGPQT
jgi:hypothetical protein